MSGSASHREAITVKVYLCPWTDFEDQTFAEFRITTINKQTTFNPYPANTESD